MYGTGLYVAKFFFENNIYCLFIYGKDCKLQWRAKFPMNNGTFFPSPDVFLRPAEVFIVFNWSKIDGHETLHKVFPKRVFNYNSPKNGFLSDRLYELIEA